MKKIFLLFLISCGAVLFASGASAASSILSESVLPPSVTYIEAAGDGDAVIGVSYTASAEDCETVRTAYLGQLLEKHTEEEIAASATAWILSETKLFCEVSADGINWCTVKVLDPGTGSTEISYIHDILPALDRGGVDLSMKFYGFDAKLRFLLASADYSFSSDKTVYVITAPSEIYTLHCPEYTFIDAVLPEDASLPAEIPRFTLYPNEPVTLPYPTRRGYLFAGWQKWDNLYLETVPEKTHYLRIEARWDPRSYAVNYILSTDIKFSFGRADNKSNPTTYTVGAHTQLHDIKSPVGGYSFDGWYLSRDFSGERLYFLPEDTVGDVILYAKWISDEDKQARDADKNEAYALSLHYGDIDMDDKITSADARIALRAAVGLEKLSAEAAKRADIFDTGIITSSNARSILRVSVGLDSLYTILTFYGIIMPA